MSDDENENFSESYIYIYIEPSKVGKKGIKQIVPSSCIKKFDFNEYKQNANTYKDKKLKVRLNADSEKEKCYVLYAGESYHEVSKAIRNRRFRIPNSKFTESLDDDSTTADASNAESDNSPTVEEQEKTEEEQRKLLIKNSKNQRKQVAKTKTNANIENNSRIIDKYLQNSIDDEELEISQPIPQHLPVQNNCNSSPEITGSNQSIYVKQLERQLANARKELMEIKQIHNDNCDKNNPVCDSACEVDVFKVHDKIYSYNKEKKEEQLEYDEKGNVHLGLSVYCNPVAFSDSFKTKNPSKCLALLSEGVYGLNELSKRCVRKQKNTQSQKMLSPIKKMAIERKVYAFMRIKDKTISQVDDFLNNLNVEHRKVINNAIVRLQNIEKQKQRGEELDAQLREDFSNP